jgi:hypothetical protein
MHGEGQADRRIDPSVIDAQGKNVFIAAAAAAADSTCEISP